MGCIIQGGMVRRADAWYAVGLNFLAALAFTKYNLRFVDSWGDRINHASGDLDYFWENLGNICFIGLRWIRTSCSRCWGPFFSKAPVVQGAWVDSTSYWILQPGSNVGMEIASFTLFHSKDFHYGQGQDHSPGSLPASAASLSIAM